MRSKRGWGSVSERKGRSTNMGQLTIQERLLIAFVLTALLVGTITKFCRDWAALGRESSPEEKIAHESPGERE